jgi:general secretion pathway protein A
MANTIFNFFGLRENPFKINPDPRFLFVTEQARATSAELAYAIRTRKGLVLLTGEVGTGKTMLLRRLLDWLYEQNMPTALVFNSHIKPEHLLNFILNDFGVPCTSNLKSEKLLALNRWLLERYRAGQIPVLIVDEAQGLDPATLEEIRLLLNFETPREKLLQIVLAGQPELEIKLKRHELRQLRQRITIRCRTFPLTLEETNGYILERLRVAGANGNTIFAQETVSSIYAYSHGIPRVINVLCEHSLVNACADGANVVSATAVEQAARDCQLDRAVSVARILKTGSYSRTSLSEMSSILEAISADSVSAASPHSQPQPIETCPAPAQDSLRNAQPSSAPAPRSSDPVRETLPEHHTVPGEIPLPPGVALQSDAPASALQSPELAVESDVILAEAPTVQASLTRRPPSQSRASSRNFLRAWGTSFLSDVRAASRQLRGAVHSFGVHYVAPFVRNLNGKLHQLGIRASHSWSETRWKDMSARAVSMSQRSWDSFKSAMPSSLAHYFGPRRQETTPKRAQQRASSPHAKRPRGIISLRRWLRQPLTSQHKRTEGSQRAR